MLVHTCNLSTLGRDEYKINGLIMKILDMYVDVKIGYLCLDVLRFFIFNVCIHVWRPGLF